MTVAAIDAPKPTRLNGRYDYRHHCGRLLFRAHLPIGTVLEIRCPKCGKMYVIEVKEGEETPPPTLDTEEQMC